jgi:hypothetical protein
MSLTFSEVCLLAALAAVLAGVVDARRRGQWLTMAALTGLVLVFVVMASAEREASIYLLARRLVTTGWQVVSSAALMAWGDYI